MKHPKATIRYAKAYYKLSVEKNILEEAYKDMSLIIKMCKSNKDFVLLLKTPIVKTEKKTKILNKIFNGKVHKRTLSFLYIIAQNKRESLLEHIALDFTSLYKQHNNISLATITTASRLTPELRKEAINLVKEYNNNDVELDEVIDEDIIGGLIIKIEDKQLDASVASQIIQLRKTLRKKIHIK